MIDETLLKLSLELPTRRMSMLVTEYLDRAREEIDSLVEKSLEEFDVEGYIRREIRTIAEKVIRERVTSAVTKKLRNKTDEAIQDTLDKMILVID